MYNDDTHTHGALSLGDLSRREFIRRAGLAAGGVGASAAFLAACGGSSTATTTTVAGAPKRGGTLRAGFSGGSGTDTLNPLSQTGNITPVYANNMFDSLLWFNADAQVELQLATEITPSPDARTWTIRLRKGVTFHDGRELTADDVIYTFRTILNPKSPQVGAPDIATMVTSGLQAVDKYTVRVPFSRPFAPFPETLATYSYPVLPVGFDARHPIGTGPFKFVSFTPGEQCVMVRNPDYWQTGLPYLDQIIVTDVADETAQVNGLAAGQFDVIDELTAPSIAAVKSNGGNIEISDGGAWVPFTMRCDRPPFNDVRVRQAFRLIVDRPAMREAVFEGHGVIGNDLYSIWDPVYDNAIPQREQDLEQAKHLLKQAGQAGLTVELVTGPIAPGALESAQTLAQQALGAGVTIKLSTITPTEYFGPNYLKWLFAQDNWFYSPYFVMQGLADTPTAPFNETHFHDDRYLALTTEAQATVDTAKRTEIAHEMQQIYHEQSGYIIPMFIPNIDGYSNRVGGVVPSKIGIPFNNYNLKALWLT
jgi:peptide/nickel transport system substrate-binding protein